MGLTPTADLARRLREVFLDGRWIANTNYREQLEGLTLEAATKKVGTLNTIAALTYHINYYLAGLLHVFATGRLEIHDRYSFDLPPLSTGEEWRRLAEGLLENAEAFAAAVEGMEAAALGEPFVEEKYGSWQRNIEAVIEHSYYHLGQVVLLRKWIAGAESGNFFTTESISK